MKANLFIITLFILLTACNDNYSQTQKRPGNDIKVGGECEGCEAIHETPVPFSKLSDVDTLEDFSRGINLLEVSGRVLKSDGKTPAAGIVLYIYHTDHAGIYPVRGNEKGWERRHGYLRGWVKTSPNGEYKFLTARPASYPNSTAPAHIHCIVKETGINEYYIGDFVFDDDPFVTSAEKKSTTRPGGNGVIKLRKSGNRLIAERNIYLGKNVLNYPISTNTSAIESGLVLGMDMIRF